MILSDEFKERLKDLFIIKNYSINEIASMLGKSRSQTRRYLKSAGLYKDELLAKVCEERISMEKYGVKDPRRSKYSINKAKQSLIKTYGVDNPFKSKEIQKKISITNKERYGVERPAVLKETKEKAKITNQKKYGVDYYTQTKGFIEKTKETCIKRYGFDNPMKNKEIKLKAINTCIKKYGVGVPSMLPEINEKAIKTKLIKGNMSSSSEEVKIYNSLSSEFDCIKRQYRSKEYPFLCDFYIQDTNTYIEYQGYWTHGKESRAYDKNNIEHQRKLNKWIEKAKTSKAYVDAIKTWTVRDPLKRETAKKNNLNWLEFFTLDEFNQWFITIKKV